jgi:hypothetical protein
VTAARDVVRTASPSAAICKDQKLVELMTVKKFRKI